MIYMNRLGTEKRAQIIGCLTEGMSIRGTCRITGAAKNTVTKLLVDLGVMDLRTRLKYRPQITTDGLAAYASAIGFSFGAQVDWTSCRRPTAVARPPTSAATAQPSAPASRHTSGPATPTGSASAPATSSVRTSRCG